jgi:hypothetical protein
MVVGRLVLYSASQNLGEPIVPSFLAPIAKSLFLPIGNNFRDVIGDALTGLCHIRHIYAYGSMTIQGTRTVIHIHLTY